MSWGTDLWDQLDNVEAHTLKGIEFCMRYVSFLKDRCTIENEYAAKLKKLVRNYQPKKKEEEEYEFSYARGFLDTLKEVTDIAGQHEDIAENFSTNIMKQLQSLIHELKADRKRILQEADRQTTSLQEQTAKFERTKKQYEKGFREAERAQEAYKKAYDDINLSRADIEKAKNLQIMRERQCEESKNEYALELQNTNKARHDHYHILMPQIFQQLQDMEEKRIHQVQSSLIQSAEIERNVMPIVNACLDGVIKAANRIQSTHDMKMVVDKYKSGFEPPPNIPFEDLNGTTVSENHNHSNSAKTLKTTEKMTMSGGKGKKRGGLFGIFGGSKMDDSKDDYSHLPPNQQKKKLNQKIEMLRSSIAKETAERDGLLKMREVYENNPAMGDPLSTNKQLEENAQKLDRLQQEMQKYEKYLADADSRNQTSREDLSTSTKQFSNMAISGMQQTASNPSTPSSTRHEAPHPSDDAPMAVTDNDSFEDLEDDFPIIGTCTALYSFDAPNEGSIAMREGEEFSIVEQDQGDGWTRVRRTSGDEGFVPTSYIDCHFFDH
ncbi:Formin-binding protein 1 [Lamellibrachia satsuma]|nr:Formin-binding protein 1 [Lamellibrachia satsuma]